MNARHAIIHSLDGTTMGLERPKQAPKDFLKFRDIVTNAMEFSQLSIEGEYLFDTRKSSDGFFYNWSELTLAPVERLRFGLATQRTRLYKTDRDIQRSALAGFSFKGVSLTGYALNPDEDKPPFVLAVGLTF